MSKSFRSYDPFQQLLFPPSLQDWVPEDHLARFVSDVVDTLDLSALYEDYDAKDARGTRPYHPVMMLKLLVYGYCQGVRSSRRIERATYDDVAFRFLSADQHPDHDVIASFRRRHLKVLPSLFAQVLRLCREAGLAKLGHVALDGTKVKANASKHKAMSYGRMVEEEKKLVEEIEKLLREAESTDDDEDDRYGKGRRGDELPEELARRESRLKKIREAKAALEEQAREKAEHEAAEARPKNEERARKRAAGKRVGRPFNEPDPEEAKPEGKAQRNFTDPESRIMRDGATKGFVQAYNAQAAVDSGSQIIVAAELTQQAVDSRQLINMLVKVGANTGEMPKTVTADAGYFSEANVTAPVLAGIDLYIPPNQREKGPTKEKGMGTPQTIVAQAMRDKLKTDTGKAIYKLRKAIVEPVFGQIKEARGIRAFLLRGYEKASAEWQLICLTHNLLKLYRAQPA